MSSKSENIQQAIMAIDAKIARLQHRKTELMNRKIEISQTQPVRRGFVSTSNATSVGLRAEQPSRAGVHQDDHDDDVSMLLTVLSDTCGDEVWSERSLPPVMLARLSVVQRQQLGNAIARHNSLR